MYKLVDDIGWFVSNPQYAMDLSYSQNFVNMLPSLENLRYPNIYIQFSLTDEFKKFTRTFTRLQDLLALIGGFMKLVFTILNIFNLIIRVYLIDYYLINRIFDNETSTNFRISKNNVNLLASPIPSTRRSRKSNFNISEITKSKITIFEKENKERDSELKLDKSNGKNPEEGILFFIYLKALRVQLSLGIR